MEGAPRLASGCRVGRPDFSSYAGPLERFRPNVASGGRETTAFLSPSTVMGKPQDDAAVELLDNVEIIDDFDESDILSRGSVEIRAFRLASNGLIGASGSRELSPGSVS